MIGAEPAGRAGGSMGMTPFVPALFAALIPAELPPALADLHRVQEEAEDGLDLMGRGLGMMLEGLTDEMSPALRQLREFRDLAGQIDEYDRPEMLPNGDILIRRKVPLEEPPPPEALGDEDSEIDL